MQGLKGLSDTIPLKSFQRPVINVLTDVVCATMMTVEGQMGFWGFGILDNTHQSITVLG